MPKRPSKKASKPTPPRRHESAAELHEAARLERRRGDGEAAELLTEAARVQERREGGR